MSNHTPTPFYVKKYEARTGYYYIIHSKDENICKFEVAGAVESRKESNAAFLVTAANAHADLVAALKAIDEALTKGELKFTNRRQGDSDPYHPANVLLGKALEILAP